MMHQQTQELEEQAKVIDTQLDELKAFQDHMTTLSESEEKEMLAMLGKGVFIKTNIAEKELFVDVGKGYLVKKKPEDALDIIKEQTGRLGELKVQVVTQYEQLTTQLQMHIQDLEAQQAAGPAEDVPTEEAKEA